MDRLNTKTMLTRRHIAVHQDEICVMCDTGATETIDHLFFVCPFASHCWRTLNFTWYNSIHIEDRLYHGRIDNGQDFLTEAMMIAAWEL